MSGIAIGGLVIAAGSAAYGIYQSEEAKKEAKERGEDIETEAGYDVALAKATAEVNKQQTELANAKQNAQKSVVSATNKIKNQSTLINTAIIGGSILVGAVLSIFIIKKK